mgnify:CR=1 FL=1
MIVKKYVDENDFMLVFYNHKKIIARIDFHVYNETHPFFKEIENISETFVADVFETNTSRECDFFNIINFLKNTLTERNRIVFEINKIDRKVIPFLIKNGFVDKGNNIYEFERNSW